MITTGGTFLYLKRNELRKKRANLLLKLRSIGPDDPELDYILQEALRLFDANRSGTFEHDELDLLDHLNAGTELRSVVCDGVGQPCGPEAPKKKKKKKAAKAR